MKNFFVSIDQSLTPVFPSACRLLCSLGVTENYKGFLYTAYAASLCTLEQERLLLVTKHLYPDVARYFGTTWQSIERNVRTIINVACKHNYPYLVYLSQNTLEGKPSCAQFLSILSRCLRSPADAVSLPDLANESIHSSL